MGDKAKPPSTIEIFLRLRPVRSPSDRVAVDQSEAKVEFNIPRDTSQGYINNQREHYDFRFNGILTQEAKQDEVFERVARPVVQGALEGLNGTIFAYGQTGSGKTFTMTGGPERYVDRGIIPRSLSAIFAEVSKRSDYRYTVHVSYLEIYNEIGYDLLDPDREVMALEDLPRVHVMENDDNEVSYRNLGVHPAHTEEEALNLLFLGDTNRVIGSTLMNQSSSRSHCIFTVYVEAHKNGEDTVRRSKLNLVDLAGSERVSKTGAEGDTLKQAKYINLSLHYLEQVIIALQERAMGMSRPHIPYRNSMMTTALKDSLGGNCRTVMVATINVEAMQLDESISTCRFAVRVAMVKNQVMVNEEMDPSLVIKRLKQEIRDLKEECRLLKGGEEQRGALTPDEMGRLQKQIEAFCVDDSPDAAPLSFGGSMLFIRAAFDIFKSLLKEGGGSIGSLKGGGGGGKSPLGGKGGDSDAAADQIKKLKLQVQQRDNEINILVSMLQKKEAAGGGGGGGGGGMLVAPQFPLPSAASNPARGSLESNSLSQPATYLGGSTRGAGVTQDLLPSTSPSIPSSASDDLSALMNANLLGDRNKAFELFRKSYRQNEVIEENKLLLKNKYDAAKALGHAVNDSKERITELKNLIEQRRVQRAMMGDEGEDEEEDPEEGRCKDLIEKEKKRYKDSFGQLRDLKKEIEHLHLLLEQSRARLQKDFEQWMVLMSRQQQQQPGGGGGGGGGGPAPVVPSPSPPPRPRQAWGAEETSVPGPSLSQHQPAPPLPGPANVGGGGGLAQLMRMVDPKVLELARPYLTGNAEADEDIIRFYEAKAKLQSQMKK